MGIIAREDLGERSGSLCTRLQEINTAKGCESNAMPRQRIRDITRLCHSVVDISGSELSSIMHVREKIITHDPSLGLTHVSFAGDKNPSDSSYLMINLCIRSLSWIFTLMSRCKVLWYNGPGIQVHHNSCHLLWKSDDCP